MDTLEVLKVIRDIVVPIAAAVAAYFAWRAGRKVDEVHLSLNSRLDQMLTATGKAGEIKGRDDERARSA